MACRWCSWSWRRPGPILMRSCSSIFSRMFLLADILAAIAGGESPEHIFRIRGGHRIRGSASGGPLRVTAVGAGAESEVLELQVAPIGDYSTYTLEVDFGGIDPVFNEIDFKFRPGCFNTDCSPAWEAAPPVQGLPKIDYLAKDYDSFRHLMINWMRERVDGWTATSEADLSVVLIDLISAAADELSDYQDRVIAEAFLSSARRRLSLTRHARLMDYHVHQGNQGSAWIACTLASGQTAELSPGLQVWAQREGGEVVFVSREGASMDAALNAMSLHTWSGARPGLSEGATSADLVMPDESTAERLRDGIRAGKFPYLLLQEHKDADTGSVNAADSSRRHLLSLVDGEDEGAAEVGEDALEGLWYLRVTWREEDALPSDYYADKDGSDGSAHQDIILFHGNLVQTYQGPPVEVLFMDPEYREPQDDPLAQLDPREQAYTRGDWGVVARLPSDLPLLFRDTEPGSEVPPQSTMEIEVRLEGGGVESEWEERISLIHSLDDDSHFIVEVEDGGRASLRFGDGINGKSLPAGAEIACSFQSGFGTDGNVGADCILYFDDGGDPEFAKIESVWNPFDVSDGRAQEPAEEIVRNAPEAYRAKQLRAVSLQDYIDRAEEIEGVSRAAARFRWTGSWRAVQVIIDPVGGGELGAELREEVAGQLTALRLIGEDLELRGPKYLPLEIELRLCASPDTWVEDLRYEIEQALSSGTTADGEMAFFHPDRWTFGQALRASEILGVVEGIAGVEHVLSLSMKRWNEASSASSSVVEVQAHEIIQVQNDPDHMELGFISIDIRGGRQ